MSARVAVVTGSSRGIGYAIAMRLARDGFFVVGTATSAAGAERFEQAVHEAGHQGSGRVLDVADAGSVDRFVAAVTEDWGVPAALVNNAGITRDTLLIRMSEEDWDKVLQVNLKGAFLFTKAVARPMMKQRAGAIVNVASIIGLIGNAGQCNYAASKAGLIALTKSVAKELAARNIRANAVAPGFIKTKMTEKLTEDIQKKMLEAIPLGRFGLPEDVANVVLFLASDAASYVTGQVLTVCGGMVTA